MSGADAGVVVVVVVVDKGDETTAVELLGLSDAGILNADLLGELGFDDEILLRNCCRSSSVVLC